jgi:predicted dehydrogenase
VDAYKAEGEHFRDCIINGTPPMPAAEEGLAVQKVLDGIQASAAAGTEVAIA